MRDLGLKIRMAIASTVLMAIYVLVGLLMFEMGGVGGVVIGLPFLIGAQYLVTVQLPLWREDSQEITSEEFPELHNRAEYLAEELGIAKPTMYLVSDDTMNARAHGRRGNGKVYLNRGLIRRMSTDELEPILAHEFTHLKNRDSILMNLSISIVTIISSILFLLFLLASLDSDRPWLTRFVGGLISLCVHFFLLIFVGVISRYREYVADEAAVRVTGNYDGMRSALSKLRTEKQRIGEGDMSARQGAISFVDFSGGVAGRLLRTHPTLDKRISRIENLKGDSNGEASQSRESVTAPRAVSDSSDRAVNNLTDKQLIKELQSMDEYEFEQLVGSLWRELGWETTVTTASMDQGVDVIAERESPFYQKQIIQAKRYGPDNSVSSSEVQQYAGLLPQEDNVDAVVVVTTSQFTSNAQEIAAESNVKLVDCNELCEMIRHSEVEPSLDKYIRESSS